MRPVERVPIDPALDFALREWGRWARVGRAEPHSTCASAEKFHVPELGEIYASEPRPIPPDVRDAWRIETLWRTVVPLRERLLLRAHYVTAPVGSLDAWARHVRTTSRKIGIRPGNWAVEVGTSARIIGGYIFARHW